METSSIICSQHSMLQMGRVAQSVQRLATGWTVRGSNPGGGEIFLTYPDRPWCPYSLLYNGHRVFPGGKERPGRDTDLSSQLHLLVDIKVIVCLCLVFNCTFFSRHLVLLGLESSPLETSQRHVLNNKPFEISDLNPSLLERILRHTKLFRKYRTKDAAVYGKCIQQQERLTQAQAYLSLLSCSAAIWNHFQCLHKSKRHQFLYEDYRD